MSTNTNDGKKQKTLEVGDKMEGGTIFAGVSPDTGRPMYALPADAPLTMKWQEAMDYAAGLNAHGHKDWKLPTRDELDVLYRNRDKGALKGTFDTSGSDHSGRYWSATETAAFPDDASMERFSNGYSNWNWKVVDASVRPVRSEPSP